MGSDEPDAPEPTNGAGLARADPEAETAPTARYPVRPRMAVDAAVVVAAIKRRAAELYRQRDEGGDHSVNAQRLQLAAKYEGWLEPKTYPWPGCANVAIPMMRMSELRTNAGLHNAVLTMRPLVTAATPDPTLAPKGQNATDLIDTQLFVDPGPDLAERRFTDYILGFTQEPNTVAYCPWVKIERRITTVEFVPVSPGHDPETVLYDWVAKRYGQHAEPREVTIENPPAAANVYAWDVMGADGKRREVEIRAYQDQAEVGPDETLVLELEVSREEIEADGPMFLPVPLEALLVPTRCTNLQPRTDWNPTGASEVGLEWEYPFGDVEAGRGTLFNALDAEGLAALRVAAAGKTGVTAATTPTTGATGELEAQQDTFEGRRHAPLSAERSEEEHSLPVRVWKWFMPWNGEELVFEVSRDAEVLLGVRRLREIYPAIRAYRPFAEACALPRKGRWYGTPLIKLGEQLQDLVQSLLNQTIDAGTISTLPFFFYGASSKLSTNIINIGPGEGYPVPGNPRDTVLFPSLPGRDQTWAMQVMALAQQWYERLTAIGGIQQGQVPTGKASALRTVGTTTALLQQGDVRADQLLLRLFEGFRQAARIFHRLNRHFLPKSKEIRRLGWAGEAARAYATVGPDDIDVECDFDFRPDFQLSNQQMLGMALEKLLGILATPLAFQLGIVDPTRFHNLIKDIGRALRVNTDRYVKPPDEATDPPILAEEALSLILKTIRPVGGPLEGAEAHLKKLQAFVQTDQFGLLTPDQGLLLRAHVLTMLRALQQERLVQQAAQFQQSAMQQAGPGDGTPTTVAEPGMTQSLTGNSGAESAEAA